MTRPHSCLAQPLLALGLAATSAGCGTGESPPPVATSKPAPGPRAVVPPAAPVAWYAPRPDDFRPDYERDERNRQKQDWDQYWGWVQTFYRGNLLATGWTSQGRKVEAVVKDAAARQRVRSLLNDLGKQVAREWAKDGAVRKVDTNDLRRWGAMLEGAKPDDGSGTSLEAVIRSIRDEVRRRQDGAGGRSSA